MGPSSFWWTLRAGRHRANEALDHLPRHVRRQIQDRQIDPEASAPSELFEAVLGIAGDGERFDHPIAHRVGRLAARVLVRIELRDLLAVVAEAEAREELDVIVPHAADVERD